MALLHREEIINYLAEIAMGDLSLTLHKIENEPNHETRELLFGLLCLHEDLVLQRQEVASLNTFLHNILQSFSELLFIVNAEGSIQMLNQQSLNSIQREQQHILYQPLTTFLTVTNSSGWTKTLFQGAVFPYARIVDLIKTQQFNEVPMTLKGHKQDIPVLVTGHLMNPLPNMDAALIFSAKDGRQSRLLHELKEKQQQLVQASKLASMGELSSGIAHELNNPLFAVSGLTEVMQRKLQKDHPEAYQSVAKSFDTMLIATEKMRKIINHIRIFARQEQMRFVEHPLNDIIESGLLLIHEQLRIRNIRVETDMTSTESLMLYCAPNRLEQVILNLFSNAKDAIDSKQQQIENHQGVISISTVQVNNSVQIHFKDNGIGLEKNTHTKIYDPFFSTKEIGKGTGLGLSISYGILQEHQATIECISKINEYTKFILYLPIHNPMETD